MKNIILIDDDQIFNFLNKRIIDKLAAFEHVTVFNDARKALSEIATWDFFPEFILLDLRMPIMDGFEFLNQFDKLPEHLSKQTKIIIVTSSLIDEDREKCIQHTNVIGFLPKPLDVESLKVFLE